ncbi:MAG TPA: hypothetical protein VMT37_08825 [Solirubrobacterales bacterium]|nr:hypothetical protein [Solirubrobacterales bacterium]
MPFALESYWAVAGGLIPIIGAGGVFFLVWYAVRDNPSEKGDDEEEGRDDERRDPPGPTE